LYVIFGYCRLFHFKLFATTISLFSILNYFILGYFQLCEIIVGYFWLLKVISPYVIIGYSKLYYHKLFVVSCGYWWLLYWWLLIIILLVVFSGYSINGY
jgi:hypothetical protein